MKNNITNIYVLFFVSLSFLGFAQPMQLEWMVDYSTYAPSGLEYDKVLTDSEQNVYLFGVAESDINPFLYNSAILTQKYDSTGALLWESKFDGKFGDQFKDCAFVGDNGLVVAGYRGSLPGSFPNRAELVNYNINDGEEFWHNYIFDTIQEAANINDIDLDFDNNIYVFGNYNKYLTEYDSNKMFIAKVSHTTGEVLWKKIFHNEFLAFKGKVFEDRIRIYGSVGTNATNYAEFIMDINLDGSIIESAFLPDSLYATYVNPGVYNNYFFFDNEGYLTTFGYTIYKFGLSENPVWSFDFARGLPNIKGQAYTAIMDNEGNLYATGYLRDTVTLAEYTQTIKLSINGDLLWATIDKYSDETTLERGSLISISDNKVFVCSELWDYEGSSPKSVNYRPILYNTNNGSIVYDTLIDINSFDITYYAHYDQKHFYLLGKSYDPFSMNTNAEYKLFKFGVEDPSDTNEKKPDAAQVQIYPNPANGHLTIAQQGPKNFDRIELFDQLGRLMFSSNLKGLEEYLSLPKLTTGVYLIKLTGVKAFHSEKLLLQRE